jgi:hypothetical protein
VIGEGVPDDGGEGEQADRADGCAAGFDGGSVASAGSAVEAGAALFLLLVSGDQRGSGGKNCREGQEKSADRGTESFGDEAGLVSFAAAKFIFRRMGIISGTTKKHGRGIRSRSLVVLRALCG